MQASTVRPSSAGQRYPSVTSVVECVLAAAFALTLLTYMLIGNFTRYIADDFGSAVAARFRGYWAQQVAAYRLSDGHFIATALQTAGVRLNPVFVRILPGALLVAWVALLVVALGHLVPGVGRLGRFLMAAGIVYTTLRLAPNPFLTLYWMTVSLAFIVPIVLASVLAWLISRPGGSGRRAVLMVATAALVAFFAGGEAETYSVAQAVALTLCVALALSRLSVLWRQKLRILAAAWAGAVVSLATELASPGNVIRSATITKLVVVPRPSLLGLPFFTFVQMLRFAHLLIEQHWRSMLALLLLAGLLGARSGAVQISARRSAAIAVALATLGTTGVVLAALAPSAREIGALPSVYDQIVPIYACVCSLATLGWVGGRVARQLADERWPRETANARLRGALVVGASLLAGIVVVVGPISTIASIHHDLPALQEYADVKDAQASAAIRAHDAGESSVVVPTIANYKNLGIFSHTGLEELFSDPSYFINIDEGEYYGLVTMTTPPGPTPPP
jgi:hypothetical protein